VGYILLLREISRERIEVTVQKRVTGYHYVAAQFTLPGKVSDVLTILKIRYPKPVVILNGVLQ